MRKLLIPILICGYINASDMLEYKCISCHKAQKIPSQMIYKKYLLRYSTKEDIAKAIKSYLKSPKAQNSIMPKPFFDKFPTKEPTTLEDAELEMLIKLYIDRYDVVKRLRVKQ